MEPVYKRPSKKVTFSNPKKRNYSGGSFRPKKKVKKQLSKKELYDKMVADARKGTLEVIHGDDVMKVTIYFNLATQKIRYLTTVHPHNRKDFLLKYRVNPRHQAVCFFSPEKMNMPRYCFDHGRATLTTMFQISRSPKVDMEKFSKYLVENFLLPKYLDWLNGSEVV